ncbi:DUF1285 domain-containing protein [Rheinheimera sp.]|uniref:DUF1285 domain-containing protein n=1 Tax=Rheinheimera sp. TaxID=1869214 RepID=UPI0027B8CD2A|nr:DUF1285 domain-containing protein [Rheinheimera sp.]
MDLARLQQQLKAGRQAPLEQWHPPFCGDIPIEITRDGQWMYQHSPIGRTELVRLFASVLQRKNGDYLLTTPVEEVRIQVVDAPFVIVDWCWQQADGQQQLQLTDNLGYQYLVSTEYPVLLQPEPGSSLLLPYLQLPRGLSAKLGRAPFYQLAEQAQPAKIAGQNHLVLHSGSYQFSLGLAEL